MDTSGTKPPDKGELVYTMRIPLETTTKPIFLIKSHNDSTSPVTIELLSQLGPSLIEVSMPIPEGAASRPALTRQERVENQFLSRATMPRRVYNALSWLVHNHGKYLSKDYRVVVTPYGDARIQVLVLEGLRGLLGRSPEVLNVVEVGGELVPCPDLPLLDTNSLYNSGRGKLRDALREVTCSN